MEADDIRNRIISKLKNTYNEERPITISLGLAIKEVNDGKAIKKIIEEADYKMYKNIAYMHQKRIILL